MMKIDNEVLKQFIEESFRLLDQCESSLEAIEVDCANAPKLEEYANKVDRIMGGAKSLLVVDENMEPLRTIGHIAEVCKALGYRGTHTSHWPQLFATTVAFLLDANAMLNEILVRLEKNQPSIPKEVYTTLISRLEWISDQYSKVPGLEGTAQKKAMVQDDVDDLIQKLMKASEE